MKVGGNHKYRSWVEVDLDNFSHNWSEVKRLVAPGVKILQVVKADAYGHGAIEISNIAVKNRAAFLGVANADEGAQLRVSGINAPIFILSPATTSEIDEIVKYNLTPSVSDLGFAGELQKRFRKMGARRPIHIEVDTGMGRGGTIHHEAFNMVRECLEFPNIIVEGIFSHLSLSEIEDDDYNRVQWKLFRGLLDKLEENNMRIPIRHMSNSGGILNFPKFKLDMVRPGIMSYGVYPSPAASTKADLLPVMSFKTSVILLRNFPKDCGIGYGKTYVTHKPARIATIPVGYGDGYGFILSNQGDALIRGKRAPIVGRISMDMCAIDVSDVNGCEVGDEVILMGRQGNEYISANEIAKKAKTISYEVLCVLGKRAPRVFINKGKADAVEPRLRRIFIPDEEKSISRIDNIIRNCFQTRAQSAELGDAIYYEMFEALFGKEDRQLELRTNFKYNINMTDDRLGEDYYRVTTNIEYTKTFRNCVFTIGCALNRKQLSDLFEDGKCEYRWLLDGGEDTFSKNDFKVDRVRVDGEDVSIIRTEKTERGYEVLCGGDELREKLNKPVRMEIEIITRKLRGDNIFSVYLVYPTRGLEILFNYSGAGLKNVREASFFAGKHPYPKVVKKEGRSVKLKISDDEWIFPNSGVMFIWEEKVPKVAES